VIGAMTVGGSVIAHAVSCIISGDSNA